MKNKRFIDPFFPSRPVNDPNRFSGRSEQVDKVVNSLYQLANNNPVHTIITGDRGIGKSSLLLQAKILAEGNNSLAYNFEIDMGGIEKFNFITGWYDADDGQNVKKVAYGLLKDLEPKIKSLFKNLKFELDLAGFVKVSQNDDTEKSINDIIIEFCSRIKQISKKADENKSGVLLFIDEIDRLDSKSGIATFLKLCTERFARENISNVGFFCAGITGAVQKMKEGHLSIPRTFIDIPIPRLSDLETEDILKKGFDKLNLDYDKYVFNATYKICVGFPEPVHLLGSEMLYADEDGIIDLVDFEKAKQEVVKSKRKNELEDKLKKAGYGKYQLILKTMAEYNKENVSIDYISQKLEMKQNEFSTNISNLLKRNIIQKVDRGVYNFIDPLLKEYIKNFGIIKIDEEEEDQDTEGLKV